MAQGNINLNVNGNQFVRLKPFKNSFENFVTTLIKKGNLGKILNNNLPINFRKPPSIVSDTKR